MGTPVLFEGANVNAGPPPGEEERIGHLPCFMNGASVVSCWRLTDEEIADVVRTGCVWVDTLTGRPVAQYVGSEKTVASVVADTGRIWR